MFKPVSVEIEIDGETRGFKAFKEANLLLKRLSLAPPLDVVFTIGYNNGYKYKGKMQIEKPFPHDDILEHHIMGNVRFNAGLAVNPYCGDAAYKEHLARPDIAKDIELYKDFFWNYQIGDFENREQKRHDKQNALSELKAYVTMKQKNLVKLRADAKKALKNSDKNEKYLTGISEFVKYYEGHQSEGLEEIIESLNLAKKDEDVVRGIMMAAQRIFKSKPIVD